LKSIIHYCIFLSPLLVLSGLLSCNNRSEDIPLPIENTYPQPVTTAVKFSTPIKINWTDSITGVKPLLKKFDLSRLPSRIYDSTGFLPFSKKPEESRFEWDKLPDTIFNYESLPSKPLKFEISVLEPPKIVRAGHSYLKKGIPSILFSFSDLQGIIGSSVTCLFQDKSGFLWMGTDLWLLKYDGENLTLFVPIKPGTWINRMFEDKHGNIWAGTGGNNEADGLFVLDVKSNIVKHLSYEHGLSGSFVHGILQDDMDRIWVSTANLRFGSGISIIDENAGTIKYFDNSHGLSNIAARFMMKDDNQHIWICTRGGGVDIIDLKKGKIIYLNKTNGLSSDTLSFITKDSLKKIWIATRTGDLNEIDPKKGIIRRYGKEQGVGHPYASAFFCDRLGNIWLGTSFYDQKPNGSGVLVVDPVKGVFKAINPGAGLDGSTIQALLQDNLGQVWIATEAGMNIFNRDGRNISHLGQKNITTIAEDDQRQLWIGNVEPPFGVDILNRATGTSRLLTAANGLYCDTTQNIIIEHGNVWIATNKGIDLIDSGLKQVRHFGKGQGLRSDYETTMMVDKSGNIWMGQTGEGVGVDILNLQKKTIYYLGRSQGFRDSIISSITQDARGRVWIGTVSGEVNIVDPESNTIRFLENMPVMKESYNKIFLSDYQGNLWIGTGKGLFVLNPGMDSVTAFSTRDGLINNRVVSLNEFGEHLYVGTKGGVTIIDIPAVSSHRNWIFESFGNDQAIVKQVDTYISDNVTKAGEFLWGDRGLTIIDKYKKDTYLPETIITGIDIFNQSQYFVEKPWSRLNEKDTLRSTNRDTFYVNGQLPPNTLFPQQEKMQWDSISGLNNMPVNLRLPYYQNYLQFHFIQSYIGSRDSIWYRYILQGEDNKWSDRTINPFSRNYLNLPPGRYTFKAASLFRGNWSEPADFQFTILPPWWQTWWAYVLDVLAISGLAWIFAKYRSRQLKKENLLLEEKITHRTTQLRKSLEDLKTTQTQLIQSEKMASLGELTAGIAHEIQNPLNFVNNFSEVNLEMNGELKDKIDKLNIGNKEKADIRELMNNIEQNEIKINHHGKRADAIVKGMLQHSRSSNGTKEPTDFNALAEEYLRLSYHGLRAKDKSSNAKLETHFDAGIGNVNMIPQDIGRVLLNLYNNALYSVAEKKKQQMGLFEPTVSVTTKKLNGKIELRIKDNGIGVPQKVLDKIFQPFFTTKPTGEGTGLGLSMSYDIIKAHNGDIRVETKEAEGAEFIVSLPSNEAT
jgi:signal transduction histidine kinase/ligand-binding sensor domain-containing protein